MTEAAERKARAEVHKAQAEFERAGSFSDPVPRAGSV
jgi:hypothetical protein